MPSVQSSQPQIFTTPPAQPAVKKAGQLSEEQVKCFFEEVSLCREQGHCWNLFPRRICLRTRRLPKSWNARRNLLVWHWKKWNLSRHGIMLTEERQESWGFSFIGPRTATGYQREPSKPATFAYNTKWRLLQRFTWLSLLYRWNFRVPSTGDCLISPFDLDG